MGFMDMFKAEDTSGEVLCGASAYEQKYYFNPAFDSLPEEIKKELRIISVLFTEEIGGTFLMRFDEDGELMFHTQAKASDYNYDEIGAALTVKEIQKNRRELFKQLELYYKAVVLKLPLEEIE